MDDAGVKSLHAILGFTITAPQYFPVSVEVPATNRFLSGPLHSAPGSIRVSYVGRSVGWKNNSIKKMIDEISRLSLAQTVIINLVVDNKKDLENFNGPEYDEGKKIIVITQLKMYEKYYILSYNSNVDLSITPVPMIAVETLKTIDPREYEFRLLSSSPERRQFEHFFSVLEQIKKEIQYSFMGVSNISRGVAGGIFDNIPIPNGLAGKDAAMKIVDSQKELMKTQRIGVEETLKRQFRAVSTQYNSDISNFNNFKRKVQLSKDSKNSMIRRIQLGENVDVSELSEVSRNQIQAETSLLAVRYRFITSVDRIQRLIFDGDYTMNPALIESLKGGTK